MRRTALLAFLLVLAALWLGPLPRAASRSFSAHMALHMGVVALAAPLLALAAAGGRFDPVRLVPRLLPPIPLSLVELVVVWAWHAPVLHHAARHERFAFLAEQGTFLVAGSLVWVSALGGARAQRAERAAAGVVALLLTSMHMTLLGALFALGPRPLFGHSGSFGLTSLEDQQLGGAIMLVTGGVAYLAGGLWLTAGVLRRPAVERA
jgi:putative membrane protein